MRGYPAEPARDAVTRLARARQQSTSDLAVALGLDRSTLQRLFTRPQLRYDAADTIAVALGRHPSELWPDWFPDAPRAGTTTPAASVPRLKETA